MKKHYFEAGETPRSMGFRYPAEWEINEATWLSRPHNPDSWPGIIEQIYPDYSRFVAEISRSEEVRINVNDENEGRVAAAEFAAAGADFSRIRFFIHPTNDAWCRDHGPVFLLHKDRPEKAVVSWEYNAWGGKYPCEKDNLIPERIAEAFDLPVFRPGIVLEGGAIEVNGRGSLLTTRSCLLNPNRNPQLSQAQIEQYLIDYLVVENIIWTDGDIVGDDTDGHIDQLARFVKADMIVTMIEHRASDENYESLKKNRENLSKIRLENGKQATIVELPMPTPVFHDGQRLPASYANFCFTKSSVIVPTFGVKEDEIALEILQKCVPDRKVIGLDSRLISWGLGSFHCLSRQEPAVQNLKN